MQYLLMCYFDEQKWNSIPESQRDIVMKGYGKLVNDLALSGHLKAGAKLASSTMSTTIREKNGKSAITDGPFAETKEQLGGYHLIECNDLDEAIAIAKKIPTIHVGGTIEVRPVEWLER
ncbi:MAG TPA: YciI family protein [Acidobacteriota bacterium]|nr:YciI family protein [Acidobacteriota bacterium]